MSPPSSDISETPPTLPDTTTAPTAGNTTIPTSEITTNPTAETLLPPQSNNSMADSSTSSSNDNNGAGARTALRAKSSDEALTSYQEAIERWMIFTNLKPA